MGSGMLSAFFYCEQVGLNLLLRRCLSAVTQNQPLKVEIKGFKTSHF